MKRWRHIASVVWLALALLVGQQAAALHDLAHDSGQLSHPHDSKPASPACDTHFAYAGLSGALGATVPAVPVVVADNQVPFAVLALCAPSPALLAYRSRAPPAAS